MGYNFPIFSVLQFHHKFPKQNHHYDMICLDCRSMMLLEIALCLLLNLFLMYGQWKDCYTQKSKSKKSTKRVLVPSMKKTKGKKPTSENS